MIPLSEKIVRLHKELLSVEIPHAFGGALALAWCTKQARGTVDIDINIFVGVEEAERVFEDLPSFIKWAKKDLKMAQKEGQVRVWWENTPIDIFLNTTQLHKEMALRCRWEVFASESIPFLCCHDIAVLKVFFDRTKDWADLEAMYEAGTIDLTRITATIIEYLGSDDERIKKIADLALRT